MAEINKVSAFSDIDGSPKRALVDSQRRVIAILDSPILQQPGGIIPGGNNVVPGGVETTIVSYTVPTGYKFCLSGWTGTGTADAIFRLYVNGVKSMELRNSVAKPDVGKDFISPIEIPVGITVAIKVEHTEVATQKFFGTLDGYLKT